MRQLYEPELSFFPWMNLKGRIPLYMVFMDLDFIYGLCQYLDLYLLVIDLCPRRAFSNAVNWLCFGIVRYLENSQTLPHYY